MISNPFTNPRAHDTITLDGLVSPGLCIRSGGGDRETKIEQQQSNGQTGAVTVTKGEVPASITYQFVIWDSKDVPAMGAWLTMLREGQKAKPNRVYRLVDLDIAHNDITQVIVKKIGKRTIAGPQKSSYEVTFEEYKKKQPSGGVAAPPPQATQDEAKRLKGRIAAAKSQLESRKRDRALGESDGA